LEEPSSSRTSLSIRASKKQRTPSSTKAASPTSPCFLLLVRCPSRPQCQVSACTAQAMNYASRKDYAVSHVYPFFLSLLTRHRNLPVSLPACPCACPCGWLSLCLPACLRADAWNATIMHGHSQQLTPIDSHGCPSSSPGTSARGIRRIIVRL
jgi:hypothetical protein